jgi:hypothetical protein
MDLRSIAATAPATHVAVALAQGAVHESRDKNGPVFSDKPTSGAAVIDLPSPDVNQGSKVEALAPPSAVAVPVARHRVAGQ